MSRDLSAAFTVANFAPYSPPPRLARWIPFIRVADFQRFSASRIADALSAQGVKVSPDEVRAILAAVKGQRSNPPVPEQLNSVATDIDDLKARGVSEQRICLWLAIHRGIAAHQCQVNQWARTRRE